MQLAIIVIYLALMLVIGFFSRKKAGNSDNFFVAGRKGSTVFITGSLLATAVGSSATLGMAGLGFQRGLTGGWWLLAGTVGLFVLGLFLAGRVRRFSVYTLPELIARQYDRRVALAASVLIVISWIAIVAAQIIAAGTIMGILGAGSTTLWMVAFSAVFITYTMLGGQYSVIRTDLFQSIIIFAGVFTAFGLVLSRAGGWNGLRDALPADMFSFPVSGSFEWPALVSMLLVVGLTYVVGPDMYSRIFSARDDRTARKAAFWSSGLLIPMAFTITVIGMGAAVLFPGIAAQAALPTVVTEVLSPFLGGIVLAALLCAVMSSADTTLLSASAILTVDIIGRFRPTGEQQGVVPRSRWLIAGLGIISLIVALLLKSIITSMLFAYTVYTCGVILPVLAGFFKEKLKVTPAGALAALIGGGGLGLASKLVSVPYLDLWALGLSVVLLFGVSFAGRKIKERQNKTGDLSRPSVRM